MPEQEIQVHTADGEMTTFVSRPEGDGPYPVAILFMDGVGYREEIKDHARRFAAAGYVCAAPDLYYRTGRGLHFDPAAFRDPQGEEAQRLRQAMATATPDAVLADVRTLLTDLAEDPAAKAGPAVCVGYCMGARLALRATSALPDTFTAMAAVHPGALVTDGPDSPHHELATVRGEIYVGFAEIDRSASAEVVDAFRQAAQADGVRGVVERIPGVAHGYSMADLPAYDYDAAERHFALTLELWGRNL
ncbi:MAG TPA: dienelactone hydrolase family protein [Candidatus Limnocylindrales bacterium]|nr:dienelactone hydrolase family protein [Candidatus Limnocylindrales bacterium]